MTKSQQKLASIEQLSNQDGIISALAFDQRGALKRMMVNIKQNLLQLNKLNN